MPLAKLIGFPAIPAGTTATSGSIWIELLEDWADGNVSVADVIEGALHSTLFNRWAVPITNGDIYVAATPTGVGVKKGPRTRVRWELILSNGKPWNNGNGVIFEELLANSSSEWSVNSEPRIPQFVTNAGTPPIGLDLTTAQGLFVEDSQAASTAQAGIVLLADNTEAIAGTTTNKAVTPSNLHAHSGNSSGASAPTAPDLAVPAGGAAGSLSSTTKVLITKSAVRCVFNVYATFTASDATNFKAFNFVNIPSGWTLELVNYGASTASVDGRPRGSGPYDSGINNFVIETVNGIAVTAQATIALVRNT